MVNLARNRLLAAVAVLVMALTSVAGAADAPPAGAARHDPFESHDFDRPPDDPAAVARVKQVFSVNCAFCHGSDGRYCGIRVCTEFPILRRRTCSMIINM
jgi:mono/diheme cytochrome c family protein